jgi:hypothetical protein
LWNTSRTAFASVYNGIAKEGHLVEQKERKETNGKEGNVMLGQRSKGEEFGTVWGMKGEEGGNQSTWKMLQKR